MKVILAESAGFCFGVRRAVDTVYEQTERACGGRKIYTYGPIIHNAEVVNDLKAKGVDSVESIEDLERIPGQILVIRSHGVVREVYEKAASLGIEVIDATCPFVKKIHDIVDRESAEGRQIIIVGNREHPEVRGIIGWVNTTAIPVNSEEEAREADIPADRPVTVVSQTTFNTKKFNNIVEIIRQKGYIIRVINTICNATQTRQKEAEEIARQ
ncbi:MAG: 4-hydroxy-3-methylbut-2-enyl diphosphate reductase, partial [Parasporobacterium sp.]|nr:4-hydroxy-3-methylbut-2-enyl diphosphate reductase [Parasporobacterium sp.]